MYYYQTTTESGDFGHPFPDDYETAETLADVKAAFRVWLSEVRVMSDAPVTVLVWKGTPDPDDAFPCDCYPDYLMESGPRDGLRCFRV